MNTYFTLLEKRCVDSNELSKLSIYFNSLFIVEYVILFFLNLYFIVIIFLNQTWNYIDTVFFKKLVYNNLNVASTNI